jgi:translation initiation factor 2 subunit 3
MYVIRSFDVNKPGTPIENLEGGVLGGTILQGKFAVRDEIELRPGIGTGEGEKSTYTPLFSEIVSLHAGGKRVEEAYCGGLVGVGTLLDPSLSKADGLTGNVVGKKDMLPTVLMELNLETYILERAVGTKELTKVESITKDESLLLHVGSAITLGKVISVKADEAALKLTRPVCALTGSRVAISRKIAGRWRLIGYGIIK